MTFKEPKFIFRLCIRFIELLKSPTRFFYILKAFFLTLNNTSKERSLWFYYKFWVFIWTNSISKYATISEKDFNVDSVDKSFLLGNILPKDYESSADENIPVQKIKAQQKITTKALKYLIAEERVAVN